MKLQNVQSCDHFSIEMSTGSEINEDLYDGVGISLGTPVGGLNATTAGLEAHLQQAYKHCAIEAMPSQTHGNVLWWSP